MPGKFILSSACSSQLHWLINCNSGTWTLSLETPNSVKANEIIEFNYSLNDDTLITPFKGSFHLKFETSQKKPAQPDKKIINKRDPQNSNQTGLGATIKPPKEIKSDEWTKYNMDKMSALIAMHYQGDEWDFFYNSNNVHLEEYMKHKQKEPEIIKQQFSLALQFLALGFIADNKDGEPEELANIINRFSRGAAASVLAVIEGLSGIEH